jgi:DNA helicase HerA-like ATPase
MLQLLAELYATLPEVGDMDKPKLVLFVDEAHLIFADAEKSLLDEIETVIKLIRSKGVGIFFCTQLPTDIPNDVLGQLGMKVQHALRAFTANDRKAIHLVAQNYPETPFYNTEQLLTELGIGEALVTVLDERGAPTPLAATMLCAPRSRMGYQPRWPSMRINRARGGSSRARVHTDCRRELRSHQHGDRSQFRDRGRIQGDDAGRPQRVSGEF